MHRTYPAKILLFGEHTVLRGGKGLAVPYPTKALRWIKDKPDERLLQFCDYLKVAFPKSTFDASALEDWLLDDWRLEGNIPTGYGLGSSGAVCAAIWDRFATPAGKTLKGEKLRKALARMEQHFHGQSSGTDPLISFLNEPVLLGGGQPPEITSLPQNWNEGFFLLDTGKERQASHLIRQFTVLYDTDAGFARAVDTEWSANANQAIQALLRGDRPTLIRKMQGLSTFLVRALPGFIPPEYLPFFAAEGYTLKLCGAGGGGMLLGLATDKTVVDQTFQQVFWL